MAGSDRGSWRWQALIMQPDPVDAELIAAATAEAAGKKDLPGLARLAYIRWAEGRCAQLLHIGPYAAEAPSIAALHEAIAEAGHRPRGRHHEIYLGDPRLQRAGEAADDHPASRRAGVLWAAIGSLGRQVAGGGPGECVVPGPWASDPDPLAPPGRARRAARLTAGGRVLFVRPARHRISRSAASVGGSAR